MAEQNGASTEKNEVVLISLDSDDEEDDEGVEALNGEEYSHDHHHKNGHVSGGANGFIRSPPSRDGNSQEEEDPELDMEVENGNLRGGEGMMLDVDRLPLATLRSIVSTIISNQRVSRPSSSSSQSSCSKESHQQKCGETKINQLEEENDKLRQDLEAEKDENDKLRQDLEAEKEEKAQLEERLIEMTTNLEKLQDVAKLMAEVNNQNREEVGAEETENTEETQAAGIPEQRPYPAARPPSSDNPTASHPAVEALLALASSGHHEIDRSKPHGVFCSCGEQFRTKNRFYYHAKKMTCESFGNAKFGCPRCSKKFPVFSVLKKHMVKKHRITYREGLVGCRYCGEVFLSRSRLLYHQRIAHKGGHHRFASWYHHSLANREEDPENGVIPSSPPQDGLEQQQYPSQNLIDFGNEPAPTAVLNDGQQNQVEDEVITIDSDDEEGDVTPASPQSLQDYAPNRPVHLTERPSRLGSYHFTRKYTPSRARPAFRLSRIAPRPRPGSSMVLSSLPQHFGSYPSSNGSSNGGDENYGGSEDGQGYVVIDHFIFTN